MSRETVLAVVGLACQYPDARSPAELWETVMAQRRAFRRIPSVRLRLEDYASRDRTARDLTYVEEAAVIEGYAFDRVRFRVAGSTYRSADLTHWLALDMASEALRDAGFDEGEGLPRETTGVVLGNTLTGEFSRAQLMRLRWPYVRRMVEDSLRRSGWDTQRVALFLGELEERYKAPFAPVGEETLAGGLSNTIAGRICNYFDLKGGGFTVDGACASSLLAVTQACAALVSGDLDVALAGGVDLSLDPFELVGFAKTGALAPEEMRVYDQRSAGFWPGEGCGFVVLMRAEDARARDLRIHALVRGWGVSSDGHGGITRPEVAGQLLALRRAYQRAGFGIDTVGYFEGHGTGTTVGDTTELEALSTALREAGPRATPTAIGSVKANIGHTKAAAGIAGIIKAVQALRAQTLPPTTGTSRPHALLTGDNAMLRVLSEAELWPAGRPLRASVSAMGFGGINTHVVLEGAPGARRQGLADRERRLASSAQDCELFLLAASSGEALAGEARRLREVARTLSRAELGDAAFEVQRRLSGGRTRASLVASTPAELVERLDMLAAWLDEGVTARLDLEKGVCLGMGMRPPRVGFLFPGQGSPSRRTGGAWQRRFTPVSELYTSNPIPEGANLVSTDVAQRAIVQASLAGLRMLAEVGIEASVALGHSLGELVSLHWAGAFDEAGLQRLARVRGQAMADLGASSGAMASIGTGSAEVEPLLAGLPVVVAACNSRRQTVVSGESPAVNTVLARARAAGLAGVRLEVSHAFHSPLVARAAVLLEEHLEKHAPGPVLRPVASSVSGGMLGADEDLRALLSRQVTSPVRFTDALAASPRVDLWIEVGPGHVLSGLVSEGSGTPVVPLDAGGDSLRGLLHAVAVAYTLGAPCQPEALFTGRFTRSLSLERKPSFFENPCELVPDLPGENIAASPRIRPESALAAPRPESGIATVAPSAGTSGTVPEGAMEESALAIVRELVAARAELPASAIGDEDRLLGDLHLNSISVGQIVMEAARRLGMSTHTAPLEYAHARVRTVAQALEELRATSRVVATPEPLLPPGIDAWVRPFAIDWVEQPAPCSRSTPTEGAWHVFAPRGHPLADALRAKPPTVEGGGIAVCLPAELNPEHALLLLKATHAALAAPGAPRFLVVQHGGGGSAFARTLHQEAPHLAVAVVDVPPEHPRAEEWIHAEAVAATRGFIECRYDSAGVRRVPRLRLIPPHMGGDLPLGPDDVLLVTGGGKGIAAECALDLAQRTGTSLGLLGRSRPEKDAELSANLARIQKAGVKVRYVSTDVTDAKAVKQAVLTVEAELGPVTAILHGAGTNVPRLVAQLDERALLATLNPKYLGARNVLAAVVPERLRLFVAFGSIIGRLGMAGEADYALSNEWLTRLTEHLSAVSPACRCVSMEWSIWSGVGMGEKLGRVEALARQGISAIPPDQGLAVLRDLLARPSLPVAVVVSGRVGEHLPLTVESPPLPFLRFLERARVHYPGIELVVEAELASEADLSLDDHIFRGARLLPAVLGLEAMAQAVMALTGVDAPPAFERAAFERPVVVPPGRKRLIRVAALVRGPGIVDVALRSDETGFQVDHFRATCRVDTAPLPADSAPLLPLGVDLAAPQPPEPLGDFYGGLFFHGGRFRRIGHYHRLRATECIAELTPANNAPWFARFLPQQMVMGDPSARDAAIHGIQACIPHEVLIPSGVDSVRPGTPGTPRFIVAKERSRTERAFVYDVEIRGTEGGLIERWEGLRLQVMEAAPKLEAWPASLLAPYTERRLGELLKGARLHVAVDQDARADRRARSDRALRMLLGGTGEVPRRPDGKPVQDGVGVSAAHAGDLTLAITGPGQVGCDLQAVEPRPPALWQQLLGADRAALAELVAREHGEPLDIAATRVWAALECLKKAGLPETTPLMLGAALEGDWGLFRAGGRKLTTLRVDVRGAGTSLVLAALPGVTDAGV
ncbi:type I polyketide synthase [Pyxidicoccus sp. MSG2]|uniref:type I polyketide synthase n=1 Tax=Pyxidicoccus sp. MSG2 TaxID=2996790 RepID=UPI002271C64F|nr:type I polyketide synthase [Pyxidicoccus sp. MSG2]MCY1021108.1 type I polyketide synthase [Pyxidicoccus sp. MSG2]